MFLLFFTGILFALVAFLYTKTRNQIQGRFQDVFDLVDQQVRKNAVSETTA